DPTTAGLFNALGRALGAEELALDVSPMLGDISGVVESINNNDAHSLSWQALMSDQPVEQTRRIVVLKPELDFAKLHAAQDAIEAIRQQEAAISSALPGDVRIRLTGPVALEYEELISVTRGAQLAGLLALGMVLVILYFALRSVWLVLAALLTLITGLLATAAFAAFAIGSLNLISIAFAVLYIGLGIDFTIHYCLRFREALAGGKDKSSALIDSAGDVGSSLFLCAITTSVGFFAFFPTTFRGVSELGLISGTGMYISLVVTLTLLPALLRILPAPAASNSANPLAAVAERLTRNRLLLPVAGLLTVLALVALPFVSFDSDPVNLRDARSESVATYFDLLDDPQYSPRALSLIVADNVAAKQITTRLEQIDVVTSVTTLQDLVPDDQTDKLALIEEIAWIVGPGLQTRANPPNDPERDLKAIEELSSELEGRGEGADRLRQALDEFMRHADKSGDTTQTVITLQRMLLGTLPGRLSALNDALAAHDVSVANLPQGLRQRWIAADGRQRIAIHSNAPAPEFVNAVRTVAAGATGLPVVQYEAGRAVVGAFKQAFVTALVLVSLILIVLLRNWRQTLVVLLPLLAAGLGTVAFMVVMRQPFNFANVIALPLLLGVGVDNGIHMVHRWRNTGDGLLASSTTRAIWFSALTTIASFGNLAFSGHPGSASMGRVLTIGMILTTICTILLVPALLARQSR
ncbi:MAG: MMPL family transporter, partial [Gammaproteobacteria bacterium]|nr:MMPL family transporter [Gammaproteobacteria bacterium]